MKIWLSLLFLTLAFHQLTAQDTFFVFQPDRVFDGENMHIGWTVAVQGSRIVAAGETLNLDTSQSVVRRIDATGMTLLPGLIDAHTHLFLTSL